MPEAEGWNRDSNSGLTHSFLPCLTSAHPFYESTDLQASAGEPKTGLHESNVSCRGTGSAGNGAWGMGHVPTESWGVKDDCC